MPPGPVAALGLQLTLAGQPAPAWEQALVRWEFIERPRGSVSAELAFGLSVVDPVEPPALGCEVRATLGGETLLEGHVQSQAMELEPGQASRLRLGLRGRRPAPVAGGPVVLQSGANLLRAQVVREGSPPRLRLQAEATADLAVGGTALRAGTAVLLQGLGSPFDGRFRVQELTLKFDLANGLGVTLTGRR